LKNLTVTTRDGSKPLNNVSSGSRGVVGIAGVEENNQTELMEAWPAIKPGSSL
jgi:ABC-type uncharacterized transport system ATPase subunit